MEGQPSFLSPGGWLWDSRGRPVSPDSGGPLRGESPSQARRAQSPNGKAGDGIAVSQGGKTFPGVFWGPKEQIRGQGSEVQGSILPRKSLDVHSAPPGMAPRDPPQVHWTRRIETLLPYETRGNGAESARPRLLIAETVAVEALRPFSGSHVQRLVHTTLTPTFSPRLPTTGQDRLAAAPAGTGSGHRTCQP